MATIGVIVVGWELAARLGYVPRYILPSPTGIAVVALKSPALTRINRRPAQSETNKEELS